ncbi:hypothetical protein RDI58_027227 [Solanum bulbocastanum]|uniref:Uncharacterized protein n=1 Tax=Solanum bulbocastanum TaxID=147425 RepID=A0AAN8T309_SOLBU
MQKWGGGTNKEPQKVWNKVGTIIGNKFKLLDMGNQEQSINQEEEQIDAREIEMQHDQPKDMSPRKQGSNHNKHLHRIGLSKNSKGGNVAGRETSSKHTISEVQSRIELQGDNQHKPLQKGINEEELMKKSKVARSRSMKRRESDATSRNLFASDLVRRRKIVLKRVKYQKELEQYKRRLGFDMAVVNQNGKIWYFWKDE